MTGLSNRVCVAVLLNNLSLIEKHDCFAGMGSWDVFDYHPIDFARTRKTRVPTGKACDYLVFFDNQLYTATTVYRLHHYVAPIRWWAAVEPQLRTPTVRLQWPTVLTAAMRPLFLVIAVGSHSANSRR